MIGFCQAMMPSAGQRGAASLIATPAAPLASDLPTNPPRLSGLALESGERPSSGGPCELPLFSATISGVTGSPSRSLLSSALAGALLLADGSEGRMARAWPDSWAGIGYVIDACTRWATTRSSVSRRSAGAKLVPRRWNHRGVGGGRRQEQDCQVQEHHLPGVG